MPDPNPLRCPSCGESDLRPSLRRARAAAASSDDLPPARYSCRSPDCGWRGSVASQLPPAAGGFAAAWRQRPLRSALLGLTLLAAVGVSGSVLLVSGLETWGRHAAGLDVAPGRSHDGLPLAPASMPQGGQMLQVAGSARSPGASTGTGAALSLRQGCAWGQPGRNPYRGSTEQALAAAGLPPEVVRQIAAQRQAGQKVGRLKISREAIRLEDGSRDFNPRQMAMSFGTTMCLNARVNFAPGHVEAADLYEARDAQGQLHAVMVPDVCGNVTVLSTRPAGGVVAGVSGTLADRSLALAAVADLLAQAPAGAEALAGDAGAGAVDGAGGGAAPGTAAQQGAGGADGADAQAGSGAAVEAATATDGTADPAGTGRSAVGGVGGRTGAGSGSGGGGGGGGGADSGSAPASRGERAVAWTDLGGGWLPRTTLIAGLQGSAVVLGQASTTMAVLAAAGSTGGTGGTGGKGGTDATSTRQNTSDLRTVPEPGTLLCVLAALGGLILLGRRG